jgi:hypothetical protein
MPKIELHHTQLFSLFDEKERTDFIRQIVALIRFVAAGEANIGHLRKNGTQIHRSLDASGHLVDEPVLHPPQRVMDEREQAEWRESMSDLYTS